MECPNCKEPVVILKHGMCFKCWRESGKDTSIKELVALLERYYKEVPLGHHPHMMAHEVEEVLAKYKTPSE